MGGAKKKKNGHNSSKDAEQTHQTLGSAIFVTSLGGQPLSLGNNSSPQPWYLILVEYVSILQTFLE